MKCAGNSISKIPILTAYSIIRLMKMGEEFQADYASQHSFPIAPSRLSPLMRYSHSYSECKWKSPISHRKNESWGGKWRKLPRFFRFSLSLSLFFVHFSRRFTQSCRARIFVPDHIFHSFPLYTVSFSWWLQNAAINFLASSCRRRQFLLTLSVQTNVSNRRHSHLHQLRGRRELIIKIKIQWKIDSIFIVHE